MNKPLPSDFPDIDLEAWNAAVPFPEPQATVKPSRQPQTESPPFVLSPVEARGIRRRRKESS